jgi:hypothetical protein
MPVGALPAAGAVNTSVHAIPALVEMKNPTLPLAAPHVVKIEPSADERTGGK